MVVRKTESVPASKFNQQEFNSFVKQYRVVGFFEKPITLKSGRPSFFYANWRTVADDVWRTDRLSDFVLSFIESNGLKPDTIYGIPEGPTKLAVLSQYKLAKTQENYAEGSHNLSMGRGKPKDGHGDPKDTHFLGVPRGGTVVLEDVTTTGGSLIEGVKKLQGMGINVIAAVGLMNRNEKTVDGRSVEEALRDLGVEYYSMSNALELLPQLIAEQKPEKSIVDGIVKEFNEFGVRPLILDMLRPTEEPAQTTV